jgi:fatty acid desaturase
MKSAKGDLFPPDFILSKNFYTDFNGELSLLITLVCLFMIAFSREKVEDEYVRIIRLRALQISVYTSYLIFAVASIFIYGVSFLYVMFANVFTVLFIFIVVFYYNLHIKSGISKSQAA